MASLPKVLIGFLCLVVTSSILFSNCAPIQDQFAISSPTNAPSQPVRTCYPGSGATGSPQTVEQAVALINSLPMPVSVSCFLESLDRPLDIYGTNSTGSAQPSYDAQNPRIFIIRNNLYIAVTTKGLARDLVEFSVLQSPSTSQKAELQFPITSPILTTLPFDRIRTFTGTTCGLCHTGEVNGPSSYSYTSKAARPNPFARITLDSMKQFYQNCDRTTDPVRCDIFRGIFGFGEVRSKDFPTSMPTI